jgi:2-oxoglutarate/2-oxoacid ferredoxin oxidoreductase subunit alpha
MSARATDDLTVIVSGQGGDGSVTLVGLMGDLLRRRGFHLFEARDVGSRVKGGSAAACLRASTVRRSSLGDGFDLLVAFDADAVAQAGPRLVDDCVVVYDASDGPVARELLPESATVLEVPFGRFAVRDLRRDLFKNSSAFGVVAGLLGASPDQAEATLRRRLRRLPAAIVDGNVDALRRGLDYVGKTGLTNGNAPWKLAPAVGTERLLLTGNQAVAFGFLAAGGRFFAGYPITPATEILEWLSARLPEFGGRAVQAEDELSAINMALGAAMTGTRAMTASSGPGIALMQESISHLGAAEIGLVVVDCQRAGPSTGMPTKPEQSDVDMLVHGASGDFPRVVLAPSDPYDAFELTVAATNLAERYQGPVYLALDQAVAQNAVAVDRFDLDAVRIDRGKLLDEGRLPELDEYARYRITEDGLSPWAPLGLEGGQHLVTGNEHDEWGLVSANPVIRTRMVEKRARKLEAIRPDLPRGRRSGNPSAEVGLIGFGMQVGPMTEAAERLAGEGLSVQLFQPRTLWPVLEDVFDFVAGCGRVYVVEHNASGQYAHVLAGAGVPLDRIESILRYDGVPFRPGELATRIRARELG